MRYCAQPHCSTLVVSGRCQAHQRKERDRPNVEVRKLYRTPRWATLRGQVLSEEPLCRECQRQERVEASTEVDHIIPHRGDLVLFWKRENLQAMCTRCHAAKTGRGE